MSTPSTQEFAGLYRQYLARVVLFHQRAASELGIGMTDYQAGSLLALQDSMTAGELGDALGLTSGATTRLVDRMVSAGYARRLSDSGDRRRVRVQHTGLMDERLRQRLESVREPIGALIAELTPEQLRGLTVYWATAAAAFEHAARPNRLRVDRDDTVTTQA